MYTRNSGTRTQRKQEEMRGSLRWLAEALDSGGIVFVVDAQRPCHAGLAGVIRRPLIRWSTLKSHVHHDHLSLSQQGRRLLRARECPVALQTAPLWRRLLLLSGYGGCAGSA